MLCNGMGSVWPALVARLVLLVLRPHMGESPASQAREAMAEAGAKPSPQPLLFPDLPQPLQELPVLPLIVKGFFTFRSLH